MAFCAAILRVGRCLEPVQGNPIDHIQIPLRGVRELLFCQHMLLSLKGLSTGKPGKSGKYLKETKKFLRKKRAEALFFPIENTHPLPGAM